jgi:tRNA(Ile)-lysidine synthase
VWVEDETNEDLEHPRNRIRHRVLPELELVYPSASVSIARTAGLAREDAQWLEEVSRQRYESLITRNEAELHIDAAALLTEPAPIRRRIVLLALRCAFPDREFGLDHVDGVLAAAAGETGGLDVPGGRAELRREKLVLHRHSA